MERRFDLDGAARDVGGVLQEADVARHERRSREAEHLPEGEVPRHHGQYHAEGLEGHVGRASISGDGPRGQHAFGALRGEVAVPRALLDLTLRLRDGFAHLEGDEAGEPLLVLPEVSAGFVHEVGALGQGRSAPPRVSACDLPQRLVGLSRREVRVRRKGLLSRGIDGLDGHDRSLRPTSFKVQSSRSATV